MKTRKVPMRMCVACRQMIPKKDLIRIVKSPEGNIDIDLKGKASGRGAYVCRNYSCFEKVEKNKALERAFEQKIEREIYDRLKTLLNEGE